MKYRIVLVGIMAALVTSCSTAYKASQTPDDVYYSPARPGVAERNVAKEDKYEDYLSSQDDQYLRMKVRDRDRWSTIDDYSYWNDTRYVPSFSYNYYRNNWNSAYAWNNPYTLGIWNSPFYYSPMFSLGYSSYGGYYPQLGYGYGYLPYSNVYISKNPLRMSSSVNRPSLNGYRNLNFNNTNPNYNRQGLGNTMKRVFTPNENVYSNRNINTNTFRAPERSYTPSSSGSSSAGSSGGASRSSGVSRPPR
jgi:hypothetical protein